MPTLQERLLPAADEDLTLCDREPIHIPGSIQPHGLLLIADAKTLKVVGGAGAIEERLDPHWQDRPLEELLGIDCRAAMDALGDGETTTLDPVSGSAETFDASLHRLGDEVLVELEPAETSAGGGLKILSIVNDAGAGLERTFDLKTLCEAAARMFRQLTGYDRVMIYRFQEDGAGSVLAEDRDPMLESFLNHQFPATDIPRQARALYVRNRIRVIPDTDYEPAPIRSSESDLSRIDLSDIGLRSVSPIHLRYLKNMAVGASASISIVKDGHLWGLVACHHSEPKRIPLGTRMACRLLAGSLSRQIVAKDEAELLRERVRIRGSEDAAMAVYEPEVDFDAFIEEAGPELQRMLGADGFAVASGTKLTTFGHTPEDEDVHWLADAVKRKARRTPFQSDRLGVDMPGTARFASAASGLLALTLSTEIPTCLLWMRAEKVETIEWAGNPHKDSSADPQAVLTPRSSFETWKETVEGRARPWSVAEVESAARIGRLLRERRQTARLRDLNRELVETVQENELLLNQKGFLLREVNHRVQNSLQLVSAFLKMQAREVGDDDAKNHLAEAQRRLNAVALVHRRLYAGESVEIVDLSRYLEDLWTELATSMDAEWSKHVRVDLAPVQIPADRAVHVGLIMTELIINAQKYAYGGSAGPLSITLDQHHGQFRLVVADKGAGKEVERKGFGSRMMAAMVTQIEGILEEGDNRPGLRTTVTAPVSAR